MAAQLGSPGSVPFFTQDSPGRTAGEEFDLLVTAGRGRLHQRRLRGPCHRGSGESSSTIDAIGAVNVLYGSHRTHRLRQPVLHPKQPGRSTAEEADFFGDALIAGRSITTASPIWASACRARPSVASATPHGQRAVRQRRRADRLRSQTLTQNTATVGSGTERNDSFGFALTAGDFDNELRRLALAPLRQAAFRRWGRSTCSTAPQG
jgi:hypothetical protein